MNNTKEKMTMTTTMSTTTLCACGSERILCDPLCAEEAKEADPDWIRLRYPAEAPPVEDDDFDATQAARYVADRAAM